MYTFGNLEVEKLFYSGVKYYMVEAKRLLEFPENIFVIVSVSKSVQ